MIGKSLSFMDNSEQVSDCGQTKNSMFLFFVHNVAVLPYLIVWSFFNATISLSNRKYKKEDVKVNFEDTATHGNVNREELITLISSDEKFKSLFGFEEKISKEFYLNFFDYNKEEIERYEKRVVWIYSSSYDHETLIGVTKSKGAIFGINSDYEKKIISKNFYELPFIIFLNKSGSTIGQIPWKISRKEINLTDYENLKFYTDWLKNNKIKVKQKYIDMLK